MACSSADLCRIHSVQWSSAQDLWDTALEYLPLVKSCFCLRRLAATRRGLLLFGNDSYSVRIGVVAASAKLSRRCNFASARQRIHQDRSGEFHWQLRKSTHRIGGGFFFASAIGVPPAESDRRAVVYERASDSVPCTRRQSNGCYATNRSGSAGVPHYWEKVGRWHVGSWGTGLAGYGRARASV